MPAMPIAESSAPMVVGMRHTSSATSTVDATDRRASRRANGWSVATASKKMIVRPASRMFERDLVRRLLAVGALHQRDHPVDEALARLRC